jgi:hypothetical protein
MKLLQASENNLDNLRRYLRTRGWLTVDHPNQRLELFQTTPDETGDYASVVLPKSTELRDAGELINEAVRLIADYEDSPIERILDSILRWSLDILRARFLKLLGYEDSLPLGVASEAISGLREFIGYAAYTQVDPRPFFDRAGAISAEFASRCKFGHTFEGSFGITIECPITVTPQLGLEGLHPDIPLERQVFERVAHGLKTLSEAIGRDSIEPLLSGFHTGFNANMCRTLAEIYEKLDGRRVEYDLRWSPELPTPLEKNWKPVLFEGRAYDFARIAAAELEKTEVFPDSKIEGRIVVLRSDMPPGWDEQAEFEHVITMYWEREKEQTVMIRIPLTPPEYIRACDAHKEGKPVRIFGVPEKSGKFWILTRAHDFTVLNR